MLWLIFFKEKKIKVDLGAKNLTILKSNFKFDVTVNILFKLP